jgi:L-lysine 6-transaminase
VEPIQATFGDNHLDKKYLKEISDLAKQNNIPLIFDEIQTGFGTTGKPWYFQHTDVVPDLVVFGKKSQVCGVMTTPDISFDKSGNLCCTFDGDILDMLRSIYVMKAYEKFDLLNNATKQGERLVNELSMIDSLQNVRGVGLLVAFDMKNKKSRDIFVDQLRNAGMICNPTGEKSVRLRPNLAVSSHEVKLAVDTIKGCIR